MRTTTITRPTPLLLRCRERLRIRWERLHIDVRCALRAGEPRRIRQYLDAGTKLIGLGATDALPMQMRMLHNLLRAAKDDALPHFWRSACLEHIAVPLERLRDLIGPHDPLALQAIETAARATTLAPAPRSPAWP